ncbi:MAG: FMN-binding negative transcriptional regulator [Actinomycetales bacterium]|nr:FMN-binding negative transcriptional regulator [Actinomycetales bacterium]
MYLPRHFAMGDLDEVAAFVDSVASADLVTVDEDGRPISTLVPVLWDRGSADPEAGRYGRLIAHVARANEQWAGAADGQRVLAIVHGPQAYVSPSWYAAKAEHGRVVPTWNYSAVHLSGTVELVDEPASVLDIVTALTARHEGARPDPWSVDDAPAAYVAGQLRAIVGVVVHVDAVEAKAKLSQNRSAADRAGVVDGLRAAGDPDGVRVADAMDRQPQ